MSRGDDVNLRLPSESRSAPEARHALSQALRAAGVDAAVVDDAGLVLTELVANAVRHGRPDGRGLIEVGWSVRDDCVLLQVHDSGLDAVVVPQRADALETRGRGLAIVEALCRRWRVDRDGGTTVVAELACA